jgi:hypothetical protein
MVKKWRDIKEYEGIYQVSNDGQVRSLDKRVPCRYDSFATKKGKLLKPNINHEGYLRINLYNRNGIHKKYSVHRLVAMAFIPNLEKKPQVNHINGIVGDNRVENLEWCTQSENQKHAYKIGLQKPVCGEKHGGSKLTENQVIWIRRLKGKVTQKVLSKFFKIDPSVISNIHTGKRWKHISLEACFE